MEAILDLMPSCPSPQPSFGQMRGARGVPRTPAVVQARSPQSPRRTSGTGRQIEFPRNTGASSDRQCRVPSRLKISMLRRFLRHHLNALHVMAILVRWGIPRTWALAMARRWERASRWWLYPTGR